MLNNCSCNPIKNARCEAGRKIAYAKTMPTDISYAEFCKLNPLPCIHYSYD